jgi:hypothetical protein
LSQPIVLGTIKIIICIIIITISALTQEDHNSLEDDNDKHLFITPRISPCILGRPTPTKQIGIRESSATSPKLGKSTILYRGSDKFSKELMVLIP